MRLLVFVAIILGKTMQFSVFKQNLQSILRQRNAFFLALVMSLILNLVITSWAIMSSNQSKTVFVPLGLQDDFWLSGHAVSENYLSEMARYTSFLLLNLSKGNLQHNQQKILEVVHPSAYSSIQQQFQQLKNDIEKKNLATAYYIKEMSVEVGSLTVEVVGELVTFIGKQKLSPQKKSYQVQFDNSQKSLRLIEFKEMSEELT